MKKTVKLILAALILVSASVATAAPASAGPRNPTCRCAI